jgi:hypothetical protein
MWDLWRRKWRWDRVFYEVFGFPLPVSFHRGSPCPYIKWRMKNRPAGGRNSETVSPFNMNDMYVIRVNIRPERGIRSLETVPFREFAFDEDINVWDKWAQGNAAMCTQSKQTMKS